ncbi:hypothetical protein G210_1377, partial [Candida maltosa Xu316]
MSERSANSMSFAEYQQVLQQFKNTNLTSKQTKQYATITNSSSKKKPFDQYETDIVDYCVEKFSPQLTSILHYPSLGTYYNKSALATFLSDILDNPKHIINSNEYSILWNESQDSKNSSFSVMFSFDSPVLEMLSSDVTKEFESHPFTLGQSFFLFNNHDKPWCGYISEIDVDETSESVTLEISVYHWVKHPLPKTSHNKSLNLVIASVQATRILNALKEFFNTIFTNLILGKESLNLNSPKIPCLFNNTRLNSSQKTAITAALNNKITIIRGPPGT